MARSRGFEPIVYDRNARNREKKVGNSITTEIMADSYERMKAGQDEVTLVAGDADYGPSPARRRGQLQDVGDRAALVGDRAALVVDLERLAEVVVAGTPERVADEPRSATGEYLARVLRGEPLVPLSDVSFADVAGRAAVGGNGREREERELGPEPAIGPTRKRAVAGTTRER